MSRSFDAAAAAGPIRSPRWLSHHVQANPRQYPHQDGCRGDVSALTCGTAAAAAAEFGRLNASSDTRRTTTTHQPPTTSTGTTILMDFHNAAMLGVCWECVGSVLRVCCLRSSTS
eukprot:GHVU01003553.1.p1 GENE.GHVU01003553.1~~GHVU01003553.1.p1  ORF type:complete len:115 (+),score=13.56 GHVU01003553.1:197-541(+)